jgi:hypothetical protein
MNIKRKSGMIVLFIVMAGLAVLYSSPKKGVPGYVRTSDLEKIIDRAIANGWQPPSNER